MKNLFFTCSFILIVSSTFSQPGVIIPTGSSQSDFIKAYKAALSVSGNGYHESDVDPLLFAEYGEHSVYWITSGGNKGNLILPVALPDAFSTVTCSSYGSYNWKAVDHQSVQFNAQSDRIAILRSSIKANDNSVTWEAVYFKNLFETYLFPDVVQVVDEVQLMENGLSDSVKLLVIPSCNFKGDDGKYYIDQISLSFPALNEKIEPFLSRGGMIYAEGNAVYLLEKLGYFAGSSVDYTNSLNSGVEGLVDISVADPSHPVGFNAADASGKLYSGTIPYFNPSGVSVIATAGQDNRPVLFEKILANGGKILSNLGLPTAGGMAEGQNNRQLQWTLNAILYGLSYTIDVTRHVENQLPAYLSAGRNAISFDRVDTFDVTVVLRNLGNTELQSLTIHESLAEYVKFVEVVSSPGSFNQQDTVLVFSDITLAPKEEKSIVYRLRTPDPDDPVHERIDDYLVDNKYLTASFGVVTYSEPTAEKSAFGKKHDYAEVMFSARIFADTDVNWKNFLGLYYQPFKVFMIMENKQRTPAEETVYTQYIPKDVPFYQSDGSLNIPILKTPGGKFIDVLKGSNDQNNPEYDIDSDGDPDVWLDTASIYPKGYTITEEEVYWANPWSHLKTGFDEIVYEDIDHDGQRAQDNNGDGVIDVEEPGDKIRVWKVTWNIGEVQGYQYYDPYCSYEIWVDPPDLVAMAAGVGYVSGTVPSPVSGMFYPYTPDINDANLADTTWQHWMERDNNGDVIWKQLIYQRIGNYEGYTFIDTAATGYQMRPTDSCAGTTPQPHNEFLAVLSLGGEEIDMVHPVPSQSMYSKIDYKTIFNEDRVTPIRTTYTYWAPLPNPLQFEYLSNNFMIEDTLGNIIHYLPSNGKAKLTFDIDATTEYSYYWIRNVGYDVDFNDPSLAIDGIDPLGDGVFGYFIYDIPKGMGGYSITLPRNEDGSYALDSIIEIDGRPFEPWITNPNTGNTIEIWEDPFEYHVYLPQVLIPPALDDDDFDGTDDWIDDRGDRFESTTGYLHDAFMPGNGEDYEDFPAVPFTDDIYGTVNSGWYYGADTTYGDDFFEKLGKTHFRIHANFEGKGREGTLDISKGGVLVVEEIFGGSPWVIFSHVLSSFARGTDIIVESEALPSMVRYGTDTIFIRHHILDENEPHRYDGRFDPWHLSYGYGESAVTTLVGGKDPCSLIEPAISMSSIIDPSEDQQTITLIPDPDASIPELSVFPKTLTGAFVEVKIEVMNGTEDNWENTTLTPVIPAELGSTSVELSYVAYPRPLVPGDDIGTFEAGWRFNQPEGEVLVKPGNVLPLLQPSRRAYFIFLFKIDNNLASKLYDIDFELNTERKYYTGESHGNYSCDVPQAKICIVDKDENGLVQEFQEFIIQQAGLQNLEVKGTGNLTFTGEVKWTTDEVIPDDFATMTQTLPVTSAGNSETISLTSFNPFPVIDTTEFYILQKAIVNSYNTGEKLTVVDHEALLFSDLILGDVQVNHGPLHVTPVGPKLVINKRIYSVNGYRIEDTLLFEPDKDIFLVTLMEITNTGNDISSNTKIQVFAGKFYEILADSLPVFASMSDGRITLSMGALVPGEMKKVYLHLRLKQDIKDKTELMKLIASSAISYEGTSIDASYGYQDNDAVMFGIHDFQLYAATSRVEGNRVIMQVSAVNRGLPATNIALRIYPVVGGGIAELPLAEITVDSIDTYGEIILDGEYLMPTDEEVEFVAIIDDGDHTLEVFELNNQLRFKAGEDINGINTMAAENGKLLSAYPNPFTNRLWIQYYLDKPASSLVISVHDLRGNAIQQLDGMPRDAGSHVVEWTANSLPDGIYVILIRGTERNGMAFQAEIKQVKH
ncbi:MAG: hypothetical protein JW973_08750 [Bacteroidales bacterium]|nr:hypothetical protein [Bacteroidales bacterium]